MDNYKTYLASAVTVVAVIVLILLRNLPPVFGLEPWIDDGVYNTLLTLVLTGGGATAVAALRHGVAKGPTTP